MSRFLVSFKKGPAFVGFYVAGDGGLERSYQAICALIAGGVNIIEIGMPFSDPAMDGPTIQAASQRALEHHIQLKDIFYLIKKIRQINIIIPIILYSYFNPIFAYGENFYRDLKIAGGDGMLIVDLPPDASKSYLLQCELYDLAPILLISPSTSPERIKYLNQVGKGFLYYISRNGTTGEKLSFPMLFKTQLKTIRSLTTLPIVTGVGIATQEMATEALQYCDGFVVGSLFVRTAYEKDLSCLTHLAKSIDPRK